MNIFCILKEIANQMNWIDKNNEKRVKIFLYLMLELNWDNNVKISDKIPHFDCVILNTKLDVDKLMNECDIKNDKGTHDATNIWTDFEEKINIKTIEFNDNNKILISKNSTIYPIHDETIYSSLSFDKNNKYIKEKWNIILWMLDTEYIKFGNGFNQVIIWLQHTIL